MRATFKLGRVAGIPVGMHWSVLVILGLIAEGLANGVLPETVSGATTTEYWVAGSVVAVLFLATLFVHELSHAIVARHYRVRVDDITLWMLGGVTQLGSEPQTPRSDLAVAVAGPLTSLGCGALFALGWWLGRAFGAPRVAVAGFGWLAAMNALLAVFNLLPGAPLDGGRVLRGFVWLRTGDRRRAATAATGAGRVLGAVLLFAGVLLALATTAIVSGLWFMLLGWFLISAATAEGAAERTTSLLTGLTVGDVMSRDVPVLPGYLHLDRAGEVLLDAGCDVAPVALFDGGPAGVIRVDDIVRVSPDRRAVLRVDDVCVPVPRVPVVHPEDPLTEVLRRGDARLPALVVAEGRVAGLLSRRDVTAAMRRAALRRPQPVGS